MVLSADKSVYSMWGDMLLMRESRNPSFSVWRSLQRTSSSFYDSINCCLAWCTLLNTGSHNSNYLACLAHVFFFLNIITNLYQFSLWCSPKKPIALSATILGLVMVGRAAFVFPLSFLSNLSKKETRPKISFKQQVSIDLFYSYVVVSLSFPPENRGS